MNSNKNFVFFIYVIVMLICIVILQFIPETTFFSKSVIGIIGAIISIFASKIASLTDDFNKGENPKKNSTTASIRNSNIRVNNSWFNNFGSINKSFNIGQYNKNDIFGLLMFTGIYFLLIYFMNSVK